MGTFFSTSCGQGCRALELSLPRMWRESQSRRESRLLCAFSGEQSARAISEKHGQPDVLLGNNVLAHVPDINDFVSGMKVLLKPGASSRWSFPILQRLIEENQFDTIYHEHFSYLSL